MIMENINLNELRDRAYKTACEHGFHNKELRDQHLIMLIVTELAEAVNAYRASQKANKELFRRRYETDSRRSSNRKLRDR